MDPSWGGYGYCLELPISKKVGAQNVILKWSIRVVEYGEEGGFRSKHPVELNILLHGWLVCQNLSLLCVTL